MNILDAKAINLSDAERRDALTNVLASLIAKFLQNQVGGIGFLHIIKEAFSFRFIIPTLLHRVRSIRLCNIRIIVRNAGSEEGQKRTLCKC